MSELSTTNNMKNLTKFQKIGILTIAGIIATFAFAALIFGPNDLSAVDRSAMIEQTRQEKLDYIQVRITTKNREILEASLVIEAMEQVKLNVLSSEDPSSIDIEIETNKLLGF